MSNTTEELRKKLIFRSWHRGTKEMDIIMGKFADKHMPAYSQEQLMAYETLMLENDPDLYNWITGKEPVPDRIAGNEALKELLNFYKN